MIKTPQHVTSSTKNSILVYPMSLSADFNGQKGCKDDGRG